MNKEINADDWVSTGVLASERSIQEAILCYGQAVSIQSEPNGKYFLARRREVWDAPAVSPVVVLNAHFAGVSYEQFSKADSGAVWHYAAEVTQGDYMICGPSMTAADIPLDAKEQTEFQSNLRAAEKANAEWRDGAAELEALAVAKAERIENAGKNFPRLKASDLFKAGVMFVPEHGETPDPEKFGGRLLAYGSVGDKDKRWFDVYRDYDGWCESGDGRSVYEIECWMLPPALKE